MLFRSVLVNLVGNAIKFTDKGKVTITVQLHPDMPGEILFSVQDTGIGIGTHEQSLLFNAFQQAESGRKAIEGTGLGLAISKHIVAAMDGEIGVDSIANTGSCFWFSLPLERGQERLNTDVDQVLVPAAHILLVEDNPVNSMVAEGFLKRLGHSVVIAEDGAQAEQFYRNEQFDLALLDINLPDTDGVTLLHQLRRIDSSNKNTWQEPTPMVAFSAHVFREEVEIYLNAGFAGFLPKPLVEQQLIDTMNSILKGDKRVVIEKGAGEEKPQLIETDELFPLVKESVLGSDLQVLGEDQVKQLIGLFGDSASKTLVILHQAIADNNLLDVAKQAHTLKGAAGTMGLMQLYQLCLTFEKSAQEGSIAELDVAPLQQVFDASVAALATTFLNN